MKTAIIGASSAGLYLAIFLKKKHPENEVVVFDKNDKIGKKLYATGNGRCNLLNSATGPKDFNHPIYMGPLLEKYDLPRLKSELGSIGVELVNDGAYVYPASLSAASFVKYLTDVALALGVEFRLSTKVFDYQKTSGWLLKTDKGDFLFDRLVFATGGMSQSKLGSDGSLFLVFFRHGYQIVPLKPSLCPIATKEDTASLSGLRHEARVTVNADGRIIHEEEGEVLFKDDGLSGIVIFNCEASIAHLSYEAAVSLSLDLFPAISQTELASRLLADQKINPKFFLDAFLAPALRDYILKEAGPFAKGKSLTKVEVYEVAKAMKGLELHFDHAYSFDNSQVTSGGVSLDEVGDHLFSKSEEGIAFAGECLDIDGLCGGHNLTWCLISALLISEAS